VCLTLNQEGGEEQHCIKCISPVPVSRDEMVRYWVDLSVSIVSFEMVYRESPVVVTKAAMDQGNKDDGPQGRDIKAERGM
jgi:hypothetical protein